MSKSFLIFGPATSGKTIKSQELLKSNPTPFYLDAATSVAEVEKLEALASKEKSFCIIVSSLEVDFFDKKLLSKFEVIECVPNIYR